MMQSAGLGELFVPKKRSNLAEQSLRVSCTAGLLYFTNEEVLVMSSTS